MSGDRADLVIVGAGTIGGWAAVFAAEAGAGRVVVVERGLAGDGASSRAAGIVLAQGGTSATVAFGRWSIAFYNGQADRYGLRYAIGLYNAMNARYTVPVSREFLQDSIVQNGRTLLLSAQVTF